MSDPNGADVAARLADLERGDRRRMMESRLRPLPGSDAPRQGESVSIPIDLLVGRFHDVEGSIAEVRRDLYLQVQLMRSTSRRVEWTLAIMILATGAALFLWTNSSSPKGGPRPIQPSVNAASRG